MTYPALRVIELKPGESATFGTGPREVIVLPLAGSCGVDCAGQRIDLRGRACVFAAVSDFCYLPPGSAVTLSSMDGGRFALASAPASGGLPVRYQAAAGVPVELRGADMCSR